MRELAKNAEDVFVGSIFPQGTHFGCRCCYDLTYRSAQTHDQRINALVKDPIALIAALGSDDSKRPLFALRAYFQRRERLRNRGWL